MFTTSSYNLWMRWAVDCWSEVLHYVVITFLPYYLHLIFQTFKWSLVEYRQRLAENTLTQWNYCYLQLLLSTTGDFCHFNRWKLETCCCLPQLFPLVKTHVVIDQSAPRAELRQILIQLVSWTIHLLDTLQFNTPARFTWC